MPPEITRAGGIMIRCANVESGRDRADEYYSRLISPWQKSVPGVDLSPALSPSFNQSYGASFKKDQLLSQPQNWAYRLHGGEPRLEFG